MKKRFFTAWPGVLLVFCSTGIAHAAGVTLADFGSSSGTTTFGLAGWNTLLKSDNLSFTGDGGGGLRAVSDPGEYGDFRGVLGPPRPFSRGERIAVTWFNVSDETFFFTARISFTDPDGPDETDLAHPWYTMRRFDDYRFTYSEIAPHAAAKTVFNIEDSGVHKTDGTWLLVNVNLAVEWGSSYQKSFLICDKIELLDDADVVPPGKPAALAASVLSDSKVRLTWNAPADNAGIVEYLVYLDGGVRGYSQSNDHTCVFLEPDKAHTFAVSALDAAGNESALSESITAQTQPFRARADLINPAGFEYLGAFALPETYAWGGEAIAYNPNGDGGQTGPSDGHPGSLFVTNLNQPENGRVGEVSIPVPAVRAARNVSELNMAANLTAPADIRPANVNAWDYVDIWRTGLAVVSEEGRLYSAWSFHYTVTGDKHASISCCDASDLSGSAKHGAWYVGTPGEPPINAMMGDWLFTVPQDWADAHCSGRTLVVGRCRDGGLSGLGPTLYAFAPVGGATPAPDAALGFTTLLQYGPVEGTDNVHFPDAIDGYNHADEWRGAEWISAEGQGAGAQSAVAVIGNKALGHNWYGYHGEGMRHDWVIADVPYPDFYETDPDGKGWRAHNRQPMVIFFDPADLAEVADGTRVPHEPQPYAALRLDEDLFFGSNHEIFSATFDSENHILYAVEFIRELEGRLIVHAWRANPVATRILSEGRIPTGFRLFQNHPNPFNPETEIRFNVKEPGRLILKVFDVRGNPVSVLADRRYEPGNHAVRFDAFGLPSGVYLVRMEAGGFTASRKMVVVK